ncbi:MAG: hypothetical protein AAF204_00265 [Pseudomonadota bacterium]
MPESENIGSLTAEHQKTLAAYIAEKNATEGTSIMVLPPNATSLVDPRKNRQPAAQETNVVDIQNVVNAP